MLPHAVPVAARGRLFVNPFTRSPRTFYGDVMLHPAKTIDGVIYELRLDHAPDDEDRTIWYWLRQDGRDRVEVTPAEDAELRADSAK